MTIGAGRHVKHDMVVRRMLLALVIVARQLLAAGFTKHMKRAGHAEMHEQHVAGRKIGEQIFRPPAEAGHGLALQALREILRQRPAQIAAMHARPWRKRAPSITGSRPRRTVSTSGSSGIARTGRWSATRLTLSDIASLAPAALWSC